MNKNVLKNFTKEVDELLVELIIKCHPIYNPQNKNILSGNNIR